MTKQQYIDWLDGLDENVKTYILHLIAELVIDSKDRYMDTERIELLLHIPFRFDDDEVKDDG